MRGSVHTVAPARVGGGERAVSVYSAAVIAHAIATVADLGKLLMSPIAGGETFRVDTAP